MRLAVATQLFVMSNRTKSDHDYLLLPSALAPLTRLSPPVLAGLFVLVAGLIFLWRLGEGPIYRTMEGREALVMQEMLRTGNWVLPLRNGETIPSKPPLLHWLGAGVARMGFILSSSSEGQDEPHLLSGGMSEWAARLPGALFSALSVGLTCLLGCRLANREVGILAALLVLTTPMCVEMAREAWVDPALAFFVLAALTSFAWMYEADEWRGWRSLAFGLSLAGACLSKGPVGIILPGVVIGLYLAAQGQLSRVRQLLSPSTVVVAFGLPLSWYVLALDQEGWAFFQKQLVQENVLRFTSGSGKRIPSSAFFLPPFVLGGLPWSLLFGFGVWHFARQAPIREKGVLALVWCVAIMAFFSVAAGKRDVYLLPLYPAMALFAAEWGWARVPGRADPLPRWLGAGLVLAALGLSLAIVSAAVVTALGSLSIDSAAVDSVFGDAKWKSVAPLIRFVDEQPVYGTALLVALCGCGLGAVWAASRGYWQNALWLVLSLLLLVTAGLYPFTRAYAKEFKALTGFAAQISRTVGAEQPLFFYTPQPYSSEFDEFSQVYFYLNRPVPLARCAEQADFSRCPPGYYVLRERHWRPLRATPDSHLILDSRGGSGPDARPHLVLVRRD